MLNKIKELQNLQKTNPEKFIINKVVDFNTLVPKKTDESRVDLYTPAIIKPSTTEYAKSISISSEDEDDDRQSCRLDNFLVPEADLTPIFYEDLVSQGKKMSISFENLVKI